MMIAAMHAVIHGVGISEAMGCLAAMAESHDRRRRHEAKCGENSDHHRHPEGKSGAERFQHGSSLGPWGTSHKPCETMMPDRKLTIK
jgi:hypothetical protein